MQLFAIVADVDEVTNKSRHIVELFLKQQLPLDMVEAYLKIYDQYLDEHHRISDKKKAGKKKRLSLNSVKVLRICTQINEELTQKQKIVVLLRLLEYVNSDQVITDQEMEFVTTVAETFNISREEFDHCMAFITCSEDNPPDLANFLVVDGKETSSAEQRKHIYSDTIENDQLIIIRIESVGMFALRYFGEHELFLNGLILYPGRSYILTQGSSIRSTKVLPVYYSDIISRFLRDQSESKIVFTCSKVEYKFPGGKLGLRDINFSEESGKLLGIMGGSGAGKSTLLNVLNGNNTPSAGKVSINGIDIHHEKDKIEGVIGYVSQDDLLIEELTVFQNLYYNSKLCFANKKNEEIVTMVNNTLNSLGLTETSDLKVGSPLDKTISGGQRKRLNIALELIREPSVLFVDEPTSGLSSRDSEIIMDLLKELALKGKLVFVVIHQPSSEIFKMFDKLMILDVGGYPIYYGNPVDGIVYFKHIVQHVKASESECVECGNVNPEIIFNILESKVVDEYGNQTDKRKISPLEWNDNYREKLEDTKIAGDEGQAIPESTFKVPNLIKQFRVFIVRDVLSKLTNTQYMLINMLMAPGLALLLAYFVKFYETDISNELGYIYYDNENLPIYIFMAVLVAFFIGLTVSAEEIISDQKIRKRESFLNLSKGSYLASKVTIMIVLSAIQTFSFLLVGNFILDIRGMWMDYWLVLFSVACCANMFGLNLSASFNSAVTIYILIPFVIVPQMVFSGVMVKFEKLNPVITSQSNVPLIGEIMPSRWAFEALAVRQFKENKYERQFYHYNKDMSIAGYKKNFWLANIYGKLGAIESDLHKPEKKQELEDAVKLVNDELVHEKRRLAEAKVIKRLKKPPFPELKGFSVGNVTPEGITQLKLFLDELKSYYRDWYNMAERAVDDKVRKMQQTEEEKEAYIALKNNYENESLTELVRNKANLTQIVEVDGRLIQRTDPIFNDPDKFRAHFYAPRKKIFGQYFDTYWVNISILWIMSILCIFTLYFDVFRKVMEGPGKLIARFGGGRKF